MDTFKNFLKGKKIEKHFKKSGKGATLGSASNEGPSITTGSEQGVQIDRVAGADVAAAAALKRLYKNEQPQMSAGQKKIQMIAQRELEEERRRQTPTQQMAELGLEPRREVEVREMEHSGLIAGVFYTCELLDEGVSMKKADLITAIEEFLREQISDSDDPVTAAIMLLYSVNTTAAKNSAVETIGKYLQNIIESSDPKFRRIRVANKAFQDRVGSVKGGPEFLRAIGFRQEQQSMKDGDPLETFYVMSAEMAEDTGKLVTYLEALNGGQAVPIKVARNTSIYHLKENQKVPVPQVSADFYDLTADEVKRMQQMKTEEVNRMLTLRTSAMREKDEKQQQFRYKYTLIRIRLPDSFMLEGTFGCYEPLSNVRNFIHSHLAEELKGVVWILKDPLNGSKQYSDESLLGRLELAPAAVLHVDFQEAISGPVLAQKYREAATEFGA